MSTVRWGPLDAHFVAATIGGMRVVARAGADRSALEAIATTALSAL